MKKRLWIILVLTLMAQGAQADTLYLKDGTVVEGEIESKQTDMVIIKVDGIPKRYFMQQVDSITESDEVESEGDYSLKNLRKISEIPQDKVVMILKYLEVDGTKKRMQDNLKVAIANAPKERQPELRALISIDELLEALVPMYDKVFKKSELEEIIMFYESYAGKKLIEVSPIILNETVKMTYGYIRGKFNLK